MTKPTQKKDEDIIIDAEIIEEVAEKPKVVPTKPPISRSGPAFNIGNQFKGVQGNTINNRQRPGRAANRGR